ncbi:MAG TPA: class I SAM-dependent methyltransferase [Rhizomicrobium sp.]|jgi:SAM-dependent methyltransferase|nr:class I SAM-dependent methyltransferase [Rhizomicrobium sp.]
MPERLETACELCGRDALEAAYSPERSTRGLTVHLCKHCGLIQSLPRIDRAPRAAMAVSSGADWGNVRYGKGFRTKQAVAALTRHIDVTAPVAILDVGSNRGSFARAALDEAPHAHIVAVEPDERVAASCACLERTTLIVSRIEDAALESERFDVVHSCHTIEHLAGPAGTLADHWRVLKPGGLLIIDAPNTAILEAEDIVEEWFIDKHLYHFSPRTLMRMIVGAGFDIVVPPDLKDRENLLIVARKTGATRFAIDSDPREVAEAQRLLAAYRSKRARNIAALSNAAAEIAELAPRGVAIWGAGRLFDSLVVHGGLDTSILSLLVDAHLTAHVGERHGIALSVPEALVKADPGVIVIMSRGFAEEIAAQAAMLVPDAEIVFYSALLTRAHLRKAA